jgi:hypothetical protein
MGVVYSRGSFLKGLAFESPPISLGEWKRNLSQCFFFTHGEFVIYNHPFVIIFHGLERKLQPFSCDS